MAYQVPQIVFALETDPDKLLTADEIRNFFDGRVIKIKLVVGTEKYKTYFPDSKQKEA